MEKVRKVQLGYYRSSSGISWRPISIRTVVDATSSSREESDGDRLLSAGAITSTTTLTLTASDDNREHMIVARVSDGGPILATKKLDACWIQNAADGYFWTMDIYEDSELWEVESIQRNLPDSVNLQIKVYVGGVTFDDYTLERWVINTDYNEIGVYAFRLIHPNSAKTSVCHTFKAFQNGQFIGEILGGDGD